MLVSFKLGLKQRVRNINRYNIVASSQQFFVRVETDKAIGTCYDDSNSFIFQGLASLMIEQKYKMPDG